MLKLIAWLVLLAISWPLAVAVLVLYPLVWLLSLPFRVVGITVDGLFEFLRALIRFPARTIDAVTRQGEKV